MPLLPTLEIFRRRLVVSRSLREASSAPSFRPAASSGSPGRSWSTRSAVTSALGARTVATAAAITLAAGAALIGCAEDKQADTPVAGPAPSAPAGVQGTGGSGPGVDTRCFNAAELSAYVSVSDDFPWCVVAMHKADYGDASQNDHFSSFGQPSWFQDGSTNGPLTAGRPRAEAPGSATSLDKWTIPGGSRSSAMRGYLDVTAELVPSDSVFTSTLALFLNPVSFTLLAHAQPSGDRLGETFLVNATGFIRNTVNGVVAVAAPKQPSPGEMFYYTGLSAFYEGESPSKAAGLYRASCDLDATTCSSELVTGWSDTPGLVATDIGGHLVAVHSSFGGGREAVGFAQSTLSAGGAASGSSLFKDANITKSMTVIEGTSGSNAKYLVMAEATSNDVGLPLSVRGVTFDDEAQTASVTDETIPGSLAASAGVRLQVFHDLGGQLWIAASSDGSASTASLDPMFLTLSRRGN